MVNIYLYGVLAEFGPNLRLDVLTSAEAIQALCTMCPGFREKISNGSWILIRGDKETGVSMDLDAVKGLRLGDADLHIIPEIIGAKEGNAAVKIILGAALIATAVYAPWAAAPVSQSLFGATTWGNLIGQIGIAMAISGVASVLAPNENGTDEEQNYVLTGPQGRTGQGQGMQIAYGEVLVGPMMISGGIDADGLTSVSTSTSI